MKDILVILVILALNENISNAQFFSRQSPNCINPNQRRGICVSIRDCKTLISVLKRKPLQPIDADFLRASKCVGGYAGNPHVCCAGDTGYTSLPQPDLSRCNCASSSLLPKPPTCGGVTIQTKILGGSDADLNEFPWMVLLEYSPKAGGLKTSCGGSLINQRYVLTAAHCVTGEIETKAQLISIRLGEHDTTSQIDCNQLSCAPETISVGIDKVIPHELYRDSSSNKENDIALVRMDRNVIFSSRIQPICLPSAVAQEENRSGTQFTVAGWGLTLTNNNSPVKQKLNVSLVDQQKCQRQFREWRKIKIVETQLCAGGVKDEDSCGGDSGGPLMRYRGGAWVLEGIVSFGFKCGLKDWPAVYTRVASYDNWIRSNMMA